ncbi:MAG: hypothetical protein EOS58_25570 [Mesorhizobium sp.]|nr:MAG: hypothetical protein EOS58_25570 [Mesorhizobium sp.]
MKSKLYSSCAVDAGSFAAAHNLCASEALNRLQPLLSANDAMRKALARSCLGAHPKQETSGVLFQMLVSAVMAIEAAIALYTTGFEKCVPWVTRRAVGISIDVLYILDGDPADRFGAFMRAFLKEEAAALRSWKTRLNGLPDDARQVSQHSYHNAATCYEAFAQVVHGEWPNSGRAWPQNGSDKFDQVGMGLVFDASHRRYAYDTVCEARGLLESFITAALPPAAQEGIEADAIATVEMQIYFAALIVNQASWAYCGEHPDVEALHMLVQARETTEEQLQKLM